MSIRSPKDAVLELEYDFKKCLEIEEKRVDEAFEKPENSSGKTKFLDLRNFDHFD